MAVFGQRSGFRMTRSGLVRWIRMTSRASASGGRGRISRKLGSPPAINDFVGSLLVDRRGALPRRRWPAWRLRVAPRRSGQITRLQPDVDLARRRRGDRRANLLTRQLLLGYADAYLAAGTRRWAPLTTSRHADSWRDGFHALIQNARRICRRASDKSLAIVSRARTSTAPSVPVEEFCTGPRGASGPSHRSRSTTSVIQRNQGSGIFIADKQFPRTAGTWTPRCSCCGWHPRRIACQGYYLLAACAHDRACWRASCSACFEGGSRRNRPLLPAADLPRLAAEEPSPA